MRKNERRTKSTNHLNLRSKSIYWPIVFLLCHIYLEGQQERVCRFMDEFQLTRQGVSISCCNIYKSLGTTYHLGLYI